MLCYLLIVCNTSPSTRLLSIFPRIGNDIAIVKNSVLHNDVTYVLVHKCLKRKYFLSCPVHSSFLGIHEVLKMSDCLEIVPLSQVEYKYVCLPYRNRHVVIPFLHTGSQ